MDIKAQLGKHKERVDRELDKFFDQKLKKIDKPLTKKAIKSAKDYVMKGGKRLRSALVMTGYECIKPNPPKGVLDMALGIEMTHHYVLLVDDFQDKAKKRHGVDVPSEVCKKYFKRKFDAKNAQHFGDALQINLAFVLNSYAQELFARAKVDPKKKEKALADLANVLYKTAYGQFDDIMLSFKASATEDDIVDIQVFKTARYTVEGPLRIGAVLAGVTDKKLKEFSKIALPLGRAFQIQDDILGTFGDERRIGKSPTSDIEEGKKTLLTVKAMQSANKLQKRTLKRILGKSRVSKWELERVKKIMINTGALEYSREHAKRLALRTQKIIGKSRFRPKGKDFLYKIASYVVDRDI